MNQPAISIIDCDGNSLFAIKTDEGVTANYLPLKSETSFTVNLSDEVFVDIVKLSMEKKSIHCRVMLRCITVGLKISDPILSILPASELAP